MRIIKALISLIMFLVIIGVAGLGFGWFWLQNETARAGPSVTEQVFTVANGEGLTSVASRLQSDGIIHDARVLRASSRLARVEMVIKAGEYEIPAGASASEILTQLVEGKVILRKLTIAEGRTTAQILRQIEASDQLTGDMPEAAIAEGSLLPDTYAFSRGETRIAFIARMQVEQENLLDDLWANRQSGLPISSKAEAVILASVVEKETGLATERPQVAALFTTRLKRGMRLQSDPTIIYGISGGEPLYKTVNGEQVRRPIFQSEIDRKTDWNTYQMDGLPKTPICNPGRDAIAAVLNPPETEYLFFVADGKGGHLFARTLAEHQRNVIAYRQYEREELARERGN